jgi:adenylate kinase
VVFLGAPGAGKGTQARRAAARWGVPQIATGDMLREAVAAGSPLGRQARAHMDAGALVPDEVIIGLVGERLGRPDAVKGFVLDGFPRTEPQAQALDALLAEHGLALDRVLLFEVGEAELLRRLTGRRVCAACGRNYHLDSSPPATAGRCDACGGALVQRSDDQEETVRRRLDVYRRETWPVVEGYRRQGLVRSVPAEGPVDEVFQGILAATEHGR